MKFTSPGPFPEGCPGLACFPALSWEPSAGPATESAPNKHLSDEHVALGVCRGQVGYIYWQESPVLTCCIGSTCSSSCLCPSPRGCCREVSPDASLSSHCLTQIINGNHLQSLKSAIKAPSPPPSASPPTFLSSTPLPTPPH